MDNNNETDQVVNNSAEPVENSRGEDPVENEDILVSWSSPDNMQQKRGRKWYLVWVLIIVALIGTSLAVNILLDVWQIWTSVGLAIIIFISLIVIDKQPKHSINYKLTDNNIIINEEATPLSNFQAFTITSQGNLQTISLIPVKRVSIPYDLTVSNDDAGDVIEVLSAHIPMTQTGLNFADKISSILKL
jgi:hypothetical protein